MALMVLQALEAEVEMVEEVAANGVAIHPLDDKGHNGNQNRQKTLHLLLISFHRRMHGATYYLTILTSFLRNLIMIYFI